MKDIAIVVVAFNRPLALKRLLHSLSQAIYPTENIPLYICIDASKDANNQEVIQIAKAFSWKLGVKTVLKQPTPLGLKDHILICGDLVKEHEAVIVLEDDLYVSPHFYAYAQKAANFYTKEDKVAGISLFTYEYDESAFYPFEPLTDESDVHFIQVPSSWGQLWTATQWTNFRAWLLTQSDTSLLNLPNYAKAWGDHSWKKYAMSYLINTKRYFVFPNTSFTVNFEEIGTNSTQTGLFLSKMQLSKSEPTFQTLEASKSLYDAYFELLPSCLNQWNPELKEFDYAVDIKGQKPLDHLTEPFVLTSKKGKNPLVTFATSFRPMEQNIALSLKGKGIALYNKDDLIDTTASNNLLNYLPTSLVHEIMQNSEQLISFDIVIPILQLDEKALQKSIQSIVQQSSTFAIILVCSKATFESVSAFAKARNTLLKVVCSDSVELSKLVFDGLSQGKSMIQTWIYQGSTFTKEAFFRIAQASITFPTTSWWRGLDESYKKLDYIHVNTAHLRWTSSQIHKLKTAKRWECTQGHFYRRNLLSGIKKAQDASDLLFPNNAVVTVIALYIVKKPKEQNHNIPVPFLARIPYFLFKKNLPFFRTIYREMNHLNPIIRLDFKHDMMYLENY